MAILQSNGQYILYVIMGLWSSGMIGALGASDGCSIHPYPIREVANVGIARG